MSKARDYIVEYRSEQRIAEIADIIRNLAPSGTKKLSIAICRFIRHELTNYLGHNFRLRLYLPEEDEREAYVSYNPLKLNVQRGIWRSAELGVSESEFVLTHEIGHLVMHQDFEKAFSSTGEELVHAMGKERSAEWQANTFADYFLCPDWIIARHMNDPQTAAIMLNISSELAEHRAFQIKRFGPIVPIAVEGDACNRCSNFTLMAEGVMVRCTTCQLEYSR
ncbi:ImmA/IrrE family metallo-endopeptidase [Pelagibacterium sp.]|uniref:ImmA/IrrE family metallo-endopeptidase n=1 Tax=Pelagibacterium sp. TaxID=1967288 RepID=UPI003A913A05